MKLFSLEWNLKKKYGKGSYCDMNKIGHVRTACHSVAFALYLYFQGYPKQTNNIELTENARRAI